MRDNAKDYGRQACYRAEQIAFGADRFGGAVFSPDEIRAATAEIHRAHGDGGSVPTIEFPAHRKGGGVAYGFRRLICLPPRGTTLVVLCHELAHVYTARDVGHGPAWRREFVRLVDAAIGSQEAKRLADAFAAERVPLNAAASSPVYKPRTRPNRRFRYEISRAILSNVRTETKGNVTTISGVEWSPWEPIDKGAREFGNLSAGDIDRMRNGCVYFVGDVRIPGTGSHVARAKVRAVNIRKG